MLIYETDYGLFLRIPIPLRLPEKLIEVSARENGKLSDFYQILVSVQRKTLRCHSECSTQVRNRRIS